MSNTQPRWVDDPLPPEPKDIFAAFASRFGSVQLGEKNDRYRKVERFVQYLFNNWDKLQHPPYHPKWHDVNLAATVPGWTRFSAADEMLQKMKAQQQQHSDFQTFLSSKQNEPSADADREALFREFLQWQARERH